MSTQSWFSTRTASKYRSPVGPERSGGFAELETRIGYRFVRTEFLQLALTHRSFGAQNNERLEFLGDALLDFGVAEQLYRRFPRLREGDLSRLRASLVRGETLAEVGREFGLGEFLRIGKGEALSGGRARDSILADTVEAILGGIVLDAGVDTALATLGRWFEGRLEALDPGVSHKDPKTELQEYLQARRLALPVYQMTTRSGDDHALWFSVECQVAGLARAVEGSGRSRRIAEQQAARAALKQLRLQERA
jgi:ribonuclease-3